MTCARFTEAELYAYAAEVAACAEKGGPLAVALLDALSLVEAWKLRASHAERELSEAFGLPATVGPATGEAKRVVDALRARAETAEALLIERRAAPMENEAERVAWPRFNGEGLASAAEALSKREREEPGLLARVFAELEDGGPPPLQLSHPEVPVRPSEAQKRDAALDLLAEHRAKLVALAKGVALELSRRNGTVTSAEVLQELRTRGRGAMLDGVDGRFMGAVFRRGFKQVGWCRSGSHKRNQPVWAAVRVEP